VAFSHVKPKVHCARSINAQQQLFLLEDLCNGMSLTARMANCAAEIERADATTGSVSFSPDHDKTRSIQSE
jgi:hypothetical protein